jgi:hypothetical protein
MESKRIGALVSTLLIGAVIGLLVAAAFGHLARGGALERMASFFMGRSTRIDVSSPAIVDRIRQLSRLETVEFSLDKIIEGEREAAYLPNFLAGDKLLLIAHGEVTAGVDLEKLKPGDVQVQGDSVHVRLPEAQVLSTRLDNARTKIYSRTTGLLVSADPDLETQTRQAAEEQIEKAALDDGILERARQNARNDVTALLSGLGFQKVNVE